MALVEGIDVEQRGSGPDLVILHSLLADRSAFDRDAPALSEKRRVWLVNLPGYGASRPAGSSVEDYAERIALLLQSLKLQTPDLLGNGFGGFIAVALAARHGALVRRLIAAPALAAFPEPAKQPLRGLAERVAKEGMSGALEVAIRRMFPERFIAALTSAEATVQVRVEALGEVREARVTAIVPMADTLSRLFPVRVRLENPDGLLRPGMSVTGLVPTGQDAESLTVHKDSILRNDAGTYVYFARQVPGGGSISEVAPVQILPTY